jgi:hypothetical protein
MSAGHSPTMHASTRLPRIPLLLPSSLDRRGESSNHSRRIPSPAHSNTYSVLVLTIKDTQGLDTTLHFLRTKDGKELDFLVRIDNQVSHLIEVKATDDTPAKGFDYFSPYFTAAQHLQLVKTLYREKTYPNGLEVRALIPWLAQRNLLNTHEL